MKVVAIKPAFYNGARVRPGAEVEVPDNLNGSWFAKPNSIEAREVKVARTPRAKQPNTLSEMTKEIVKGPQDLA